MKSLFYQILQSNYVNEALMMKLMLFIIVTSIILIRWGFFHRRGRRGRVLNFPVILAWSGDGGSGNGNGNGNGQVMVGSVVNTSGNGDGMLVVVFGPICGHFCLMVSLLGESRLNNSLWILLQAS